MSADLKMEDNMPTTAPKPIPDKGDKKVEIIAGRKISATQRELDDRYFYRVGGNCRCFNCVRTS
jgi:hypothetical protein